jgi:hypothetical protein
MDVVEVGWGGVEWICLAQDRDRWRVLVNSVFFAAAFNMRERSFLFSA